jgi:hypothetical protein
MDLNGLLFFEGHTIIYCRISLSIEWNTHPIMYGNQAYPGMRRENITLNIKTTSPIIYNFLGKKVSAKFCNDDTVYINLYGICIQQSSLDYSVDDYLSNSVIELNASVDYYEDVVYKEPLLKNIIRTKKLKRILE